jgi:hypothetical protein
MAANIQNFYQKAQDGFSRDFSFRVAGITWGAGTVGVTDFSGEEEGDLVFARSASFPSRTIQDKTVNYAGQEFHLGGKADYGDSASWAIEFYCDTSCSLRSKLETVSRQVFGGTNNTDAPIGTGEYGIGTATINLEVLDKNLEVVKNIVLHGAQLRDISELGYSIADGTGEVMTFSATFAYQWYTTSGPNGSRDAAPYGG